MKRTYQHSEEVANSLSGGSEDPWSILSLFLKYFAKPSRQRKLNNLEYQRKLFLFYTTKVTIGNRRH